MLNFNEWLVWNSNPNILFWFSLSFKSIFSSYFHSCQKIGWEEFKTDKPKRIARKDVGQGFVFVISGILIWCPFLLPRANTSDSFPIMLYFSGIKSIFACEEWCYDNQQKTLFGMICNDERCTAFCSRFEGLWQCCARCQRRQDLLPECHGMLFQKSLGRSPKCVVSCLDAWSSFSYS